jgi:hypothetical protein
MACRWIYFGQYLCLTESLAEPTELAQIMGRLSVPQTKISRSQTENRKEEEKEIVFPAESQRRMRLFLDPLARPRPASPRDL